MRKSTKAIFTLFYTGRGRVPTENDIPTPTIIPSNLKKIVWAIFEVIKGGGVPFFSKKIGARYWQILMSGGENDHPKIMSLPQTMFLSSLEKIVWAVFEVIRGVPFFRKNKLKNRRPLLADINVLWWEQHPKMMSLPQTVIPSSLRKIVWAFF